MPDTNLKYTSENVETGSVFDILVGNLLAYRAEEWGWSEQDYTKISEEFADAASNDLYYLPAGNYKVSNFPVSLLPTELNIQSTEFVNLQVIADSTSAKTYWLNILNKTYYASIPSAGLSSITWNDASEIGKGADVTTIHVSNTAPTISDNGSHIWVDTSNVNTNEYASMKQWDNTTSTWKGFVIPGMMDKSVYDPTGKNTDPFIYLMDKLEEVAGDYAQFIRHKNNELTLIHVTSEEKDIYNNDLLTLDQISQMFGTGGSIYEEMINFIENETAEQFGTEEFSTQLTAIEDALNEHLTNHIDDTKITSWDNKANADHTHNLDNRVTITGNDIKSILTSEAGILPDIKWWSSVCYGNGKFVAVAGNNTNIMAYSTDGISWTQGNMPISKPWSSVCYGNGKYVAVASNYSNIMAYSTDGISWNQGTMPSNGNWYSVCYGNGKYVAIAGHSSSSSRFAYSTDGISWTRDNMPSSQLWSSVCYGNGKYVAIANNSNIMAYSTDGISWTQGAMPSNIGWRSICYGNNKFIAISGANYESSNIMAYSTDGITWTEGTMPSEEYWSSICYGNGKFVAVNDRGSSATIAMAYSSDGISWIESDVLERSLWASVCYGDGKFVTVDYSPSSAVITFRGFPLSQVSTEAKERIYQLTSLDELENPISETDLADKYHNGNTLYIENADGSTEWWKIIDNTKLGKEASIDGLRLFSTTLSSMDFSNILNKPNTLSGYGITDGVLSSDLDEYRTTIEALQNLEFVPEGYDVASVGSNDLYLAVQKRVNTNTEMSIDSSLFDIVLNDPGQETVSKFAMLNDEKRNGIKNFGLEGNMPSIQEWQSICYGNGKYVAVAGYSSTTIMAYSTNGIDWTQGNMPSYGSWYSVCYGNDKYVAVIGNGSATIMAYSTDGIDWTEGNMPSRKNWPSVCYGNGKFVAIAYNSNIMAYSTNGINWTQGNMPSEQAWESVCYGNDKYVAIANYSNIMAYSTDGISWTEGNMPSNKDWYSVCYGNDKYVAIANNSNIFAYSTNGIDWTEGNMPSDSYWSSVCYGNGKFIAVASMNTNIMAYSTDGISWTQGNMPGRQDWYSVCYGNGKYVAIADKSNIMANLYLPAQIGDTYLNTKGEFVPFSKFPSFDTTSKYFTTEYSTDSANPNWTSEGIGRVIKIDKSQNNIVLDNVTIVTYGSLNVILNVKWDTTKGLVFSFSIHSAVTSLNSIYEGLNTSADSVKAYLDDALTLVNSLVS